jgi:catechol 2,3-dioxygenase-like lactoylglutathione lyase family enzyme
MARLDHVALECDDPDAVAQFLERTLGARIVRAAGHPVMAYLQAGAFALHERGGPGFHVGVRVSADERTALAERLGGAARERDHGIAVGLFFDDPEGHTIEAITYRPGERPPPSSP